MPKNSENLSIYEFAKICRTCLEEGELKPLYETCSNEVCLIEKLMSCTFIQFKENDGLPVQICVNCIKEINQAYSFSKKCEEAERDLRKCITQFQSKLRQKPKEKTKNESVNDVKIKETKESNVLQINTDDETEIIIIKNENPLDLKNKDDFKIEISLVEDESTEFDYHDFSDTNENYNDNNDKSEKQISKKNSNVDISRVEDSIVVPLKKTSNNIYKLKYNTQFECKKCSEQFPNYQLLKLHREEKQHPRNGYGKKVCGICNKSIAYSHMTEHMRTHTLEKPFCCEICGANFSIRSNLRRHTLAQHTNERPHKCETCNKGFTRLGLLRDHQRIHTGEKPFVCNFCGKSFTTSATFRTHLFTHSKSDDISSNIPEKKSEKDHECPECKRGFASKTLLRAHMRIHGEKRFLCSVCGRGFVSMILLNSHSKVHTGIRPYICPTCGKTFSHIGSLKSHTLIHTGQKPYVCTVCNRAFTQRNHLKYHKRTHSGERPYMCSLCGKSFALNGNLTVHMRTHTGETPYLCPICGKGFHDSSSMKKHKKGHTSQNKAATKNNTVEGV